MIREGARDAGKRHGGEEERVAERREPDAQRGMAAGEPEPIPLRRELEVEAIVGSGLFQARAEGVRDGHLFAFSRVPRLDRLPLAEQLALQLFDRPEVGDIAGREDRSGAGG